MRGYGKFCFFIGIWCSFSRPQNFSVKDSKTDVVENTSSPEEIFSKYKRKAKKGDARAQFFLGYGYNNGTGVPRDALQSLSNLPPIAYKDA